MKGHHLALRSAVAVSFLLEVGEWSEGRHMTFGRRRVLTV